MLTVKTLAVLAGTRYYVNGWQVWRADAEAELNVFGQPFGGRFACMLEDWDSFKWDALAASRHSAY